MKTKECGSCLSRRMIKFFKKDKRTNDGYSKMCNKCKDVYKGMTRFADGSVCTWKEYSEVIKQEREEQKLYEFYKGEYGWEDYDND